MISLRPYQQELADEVRQAYRMGFKCPLVVLSTGGGKTVLFSYITNGAATKGKGVMVVAHRKELIAQISLSLARFGVAHEVIAPAPVVREIKISQFKAFGRSFVDPTSKVMVGSVQTIVRRFEHIKHAPDMVILDEAHHVVMDTQWGKVLDQYPNAVGLKVTATPERLDGRGLGKGMGGYADTLIQGPSMEWLIEQGFLSPYRCFTTSTPIDLAGVKTRMGDYAKEELAERIDKPSIVGDAVNHYKQAASGLRAVCYCVSVEHSKHTAQAFIDAGIPAAHFDGDTESSERAAIVRAFADGEILVLCNVAILTEGFDLASIAQKDVTIDCVIDLAPTQSLSLYMQKVGRGLRPAPGKVAVILDHAGNVVRHGLPDADRDWSLEGRKKKKRAANDNDDEADIGVATCPKCFAIHRPEPTCPVCGHVYEVKARKVEQKEGQLVELSTDQLDAMRRAKRVLQGKAQTVHELMAQGMKRGQAEKIVEARAKKQGLIDDILSGFESRQIETGETSWQAFGVTISEVRRMKPKELTALRERVCAVGAANDNAGAAFVLQLSK